MRKIVAHSRGQALETLELLQEQVLMYFGSPSTAWDRARNSFVSLHNHHNKLSEHGFSMSVCRGGDAMWVTALSLEKLNNCAKQTSIFQKLSSDQRFVTRQLETCSCLQQAGLQRYATCQFTPKQPDCVFQSPPLSHFLTFWLSFLLPALQAFCGMISV